MNNKNHQESKFYKKLKATFPLWEFYRIENTLSSGFPDLLMVPAGGTPWFIELKSLDFDKVDLRPQQFSFMDQRYRKARRSLLQAGVMNGDFKNDVFCLWRYPFDIKIGPRAVRITSEPTFQCKLSWLNTQPENLIDILQHGRI